MSELFLGEAIVEVRHIGKDPLLHHAAHDFVTEPVYVHGSSAAPMDETFHGLCRAVDGDAAIRDLSLLAHDGAAAARASLGHVEWDRVLGPQLRHMAHDLRYNVSSLVHHNGVAHTHVLALNLVDVVQRCPGDYRPCHRYRIELGNGCEYARTPNLYANLTQHRALLLRGELKGDGPSWRTRRKPKCILLCKRIDFYHHAVNVIVQLVASRQRTLAERPNLRCRSTAGCVIVHTKAAGTQPRKELPLAFHRQRPLVCNRINECRKISSGGDFGILLPE